MCGIFLRWKLWKEERKRARVRGVYIGMDHAGVTKTEKWKLVRDGCDGLFYEGELLGRTCLLIYKFKKDERGVKCLKNITMAIPHGVGTSEKNSSAFSHLSSLLRKKYGMGEGASGDAISRWFHKDMAIILFTRKGFRSKLEAQVVYVAADSYCEALRDTKASQEGFYKASIGEV